MSSELDKKKHSKRIKGKIRAKVRSNIAKDLITSGKYKPRIVQDKRGKKYDLNKLDHLSFVEAIQELNND